MDGLPVHVDDTAAACRAGGLRVVGGAHRVGTVHLRRPRGEGGGHVDLDHEVDIRRPTGEPMGGATSSGGRS